MGGQRGCYKQNAPGHFDIVTPIPAFASCSGVKASTSASASIYTSINPATSTGFFAVCRLIEICEGEPAILTYGGIVGIQDRLCAVPSAETRMNIRLENC